MPVSNKVLISLVVVIALFAFFMVLVYTGFFDPMAAGFYNPSIIKTISREIGTDTGTVQDFFRELQSRFSATLKDPAVRRSFLPNRSTGDILERSRLYSSLLDTQSGLQWVRFIDPGGARIHYSTYSQDIIRQHNGLISYRNYNSGTDEIPFETLAASGGGEPRIIPDEEGRRFIFSLPFYDSSDVYRGTALFSLSLGAVSERLINMGRIGAEEEAAILQSPAGIILGLPGTGKDAVISAIASLWRLQLLNLTPLDPAEPGTAPALISSRTDQGMYVGRLVEGAFVSFPPVMGIILLVSFFCTTYLTIFLFVNFRQDTMTIVQTRIKTLQATLIEEYHNRKGPVDWKEWSRELEQRREAVRMEIKRDIKGRRGKRLDTEIDACINNAWSDLVAVIRGGAEPLVPVFNEARIEEIVKRVLRTAGGDFARGGQGGRGLTENPARPETATGTQVLQGRRPGTSGRRIMAFTRNSAAVGDTADIEKLTSGKERKAVAKDDVYTTKPVENGEVPEELEEIEELGELEELEELEGPVITPHAAEEAPSSGNSSHTSREDIAVLAREIEFTPLPEDETGSAGGNPLFDLEIVSPFATMLSDLDDGFEADGNGSSDAGTPETADKKAPDLTTKAASAKTSKLEILDGNYQASLVYRPFTTENVPPQDLSPAEPVIKLRNGVNYINTAALRDGKILLDKDFQRLVDSVLT